MSGVVDAHLHVWDTGLLHYPWLTAEPELGRPFLPADLESGITEQQVFVQAEPVDPFAEAEWVQGLDWPGLRGIVARLPLEDPAAREDGLERLEALPLLAGIRRLVQDEGPGFIESQEFVGGLRLLAERGWPFDACIRHWQLPELIRVIGQVPELVVVLDHLGKPPVAAGLDTTVGAAWAAGIRELAALPNTYVKLSGMAPEADDAHPLRGQVEPFLHAALEAFGPGRAMVGSDFPVSAHTPHRLGYGEWFALLADVLALTPSEHDQVFRTTALGVYRPR